MKINWKKIFDWSVVSASRPYLVAKEPAGDGYRCYVQYNVDVEYRHHGRRVATFATTHDCMVRSAEQLALRRATKYYMGLRKKIQRDAQRQ